MKKNILYSMDYMYGCQEELEKELKKRFNIIKFIDHYMPPKSERSIYFKILREFSKLFSQNKLINNLFNRIVRNYYLKNVLNFSEKMDYFFVVAGQEFSREFIHDLKNKNKGIKCIIFLWDKLEYTSLKNIISEFDYVFSFDRSDCTKYGFFFRPFFFLEHFGESLEYENRKYDISYVGALRDEKRYLFIKNIFNLTKKYNLKNFLHLVVSKKIKKISSIDEFVSTEKISPKKNLELIRESRVICEIPFANQVGLTLRTLQSLYFENKIITINNDITNYDFYNRNNIKIVNSIEEINEIEEEFFTEKYKKLDENIIKKYRVEVFLNDIFSIVEKEIYLKETIK